MKSANAITVPVLARVEGEGALHIKLKNGKVSDVKLEIYEPPRLFEAFMRGRPAAEAPDVTARICGICPIAYQMSAVHAIEHAFGIEIDPAVRMLRRLFYCGEWIESHALHIFLLHAPDFLGFQDAIEMAAKHKPEVELALRLKKLGNEIVRVIGGREIHPISACIGGFWRVPRKADLEPLREELKWGLEAAQAAAKLVASFPFPDFDTEVEYVSVCHPDEYPFNEGRVVSTKGIDIDVNDYEDVFVEQHVRHSNALHSVIRERGAYQVGPTARFNINYEKLPESARQLASSIGLEPPVKNPFKSIMVRAIETAFALEEALRIIDAYEPPVHPAASWEPKAARGCAATEAPRGLLYHRYDIDENGLIKAVRIVPPTAQNLKQMEDDLWHLAPTLLEKPVEEMTWICEQAIRNYDPCISCATHFIKVHIENLL
jgi:sulfhydrogenase subunit alpha